ncbi:pentatricopeptide repeat-containing protein [Corchorus olitorius]|uniref:Pentatricopeptide repeat-containing protein n=1 Tax=Corchorus olitorius TaxID=93759 RepID=A0A1R3G429_9ROSI|nr:pentatricopeptide repeat-containing protein [Corchorus olitorius]
MASLIRSPHLDLAAIFDKMKALSFQSFDVDPSLGCPDSGDSTIGMASTFGALFRLPLSINPSVQFEVNYS